MISTLGVETVRLNPQEAEGAKKEEKRLKQATLAPHRIRSNCNKASCSTKRWFYCIQRGSRTGQSLKTDLLPSHESGGVLPERHFTTAQIQLFKETNLVAFYIYHKRVLQPAKIHLLAGTNKFGSFERLWVKMISRTYFLFLFQTTFFSIIIIFRQLPLHDRTSLYQWCLSGLPSKPTNPIS